LKALPIISPSQALEILEKDLRRSALEKRASEIKVASPETRAAITAEVEREVRKQLLQHRARIDAHWVIY
jgi:hypothetical protein